MHAKLALKVYLHQVIWGTKVIWCQIWVVFELIVLGKLVQIASGRLRQAMCALHHSTGAAAASANLPTGSRKFISAAARVRTQSGMQSSEHKIFQRNYTRLQGMHIYRHIESHGWTECDTEDGDQTVHCFACWQPDEECLRLREECTIKCACIVEGRGVFLFWASFWVFWLLRNWIIVGNFSVLMREKIPGLLIKRR